MDGAGNWHLDKMKTHGKNAKRQWPQETANSGWTNIIESNRLCSWTMCPCWKTTTTHFVDALGMAITTHARDGSSLILSHLKQVSGKGQDKWHRLSSHVPGYPNKFEPESLQNVPVEKYGFNVPLHRSRIMSRPRVIFWAKTYPEKRWFMPGLNLKPSYFVWK